MLGLANHNHISNSAHEPDSAYQLGSYTFNDPQTNSMPLALPKALHLSERYSF